MTELSQYVRFPAIKCWIKHIREANYDEIENVFHTLFGKVKRVRLIGTIRNKYEFPTIDSELTSNINLELDDGTGLVRAFKWKVEPEEITGYKIGNLVYIIGILQFREGDVSLRIEIIKTINDPNEFLLHEVQIIKKLNSGEIVEIPSIKQKVNEIGDEFGEDDDISNINSKLSQEDNNVDTIKQLIFSIIEENSLNGKVTQLRELKDKTEISENKLRLYIRDLEQASKIYMPDIDVYRSWDDD